MHNKFCQFFCIIVGSISLWDQYFCAVCAAGYHRVAAQDICVLCGDIQHNTFKPTPGNTTTCTPCGINTVATADHTACGM